MTFYKDRPSSIEARLRQKIKAIIPCDILQTEPLGMKPNCPSKFDLIVTHECVAEACRNQEEYQSAWYNIATLLHPNGILVYIDVLGETKYIVGEATFSTLPIEEPFIVESLGNAAFEIMNSEEVRYGSQDGKILSDADRFLCIVARKK